MRLGAKLASMQAALAFNGAADPPLNISSLIFCWQINKRISDFGLRNAERERSIAARWSWKTT
jgi:hypothetical protein